VVGGDTLSWSHEAGPQRKGGPLTSESHLLQEIVDLFLPRGCLGCGERIPPEEGRYLVCAPCRARLLPPTPPTCPRCQVPRGTGNPQGEECLECQDWPSELRSAKAAVTLGPTAGALVHALKYGGWSDLAGFMAQRMSREPTGWSGSAVLVPVPTTGWRRRVRGYNQAALLAQALSNFWSLPVEEALERRGGRTQVSLGPRERRENVQGAFCFRQKSRSQIRDQEVILIDDVLTTGATALSAVRALKPGNPAGIHLRTFARALPFALQG
jgi:ComF family protein